MKVLLLITRSDVLGGAQRHVRDLARALAEGGDEVTLACGGDGAIYAELPAAGVRLVPLPWLRRDVVAGDVAVVARLARCFAALGADVVHAHSTKAGLLGVPAAGLAGVPALFTAHGWSALKAARGGAVGALVARACHRVGLAGAARVIALSEHDAALARRWRLGRSGALRVVPPAVADHPARARHGGGDAGCREAGEPVRLITVARHAWPKDAATLLAALAALAPLPWTLEWLGDGPLLAEHRALAAAHGLADRIDFVGHVADVAERLAGAELFVLASAAEGLPLAIVEAQRAGLGVVASDVGAVAALVGAGAAGEVVAAFDVAAMRDALERAIVDGALRARWGAAGRARFEAWPTPPDAVAALRGLYREAIEGR